MDEKFLLKLSNTILEDEEELRFFEEEVINIDFNPEIIESIFRLFENNSKFDFGIPGYLVKFIEKHPTGKYLPELFKSIERNPTEYNLWMLNRYLNTLDKIEKKHGIDLLNKIVELNNDTNIVKMAQRFLNKHSE